MRRILIILGALILCRLEFVFAQLPQVNYGQFEADEVTESRFGTNQAKIFVKGDKIRTEGATPEGEKSITFSFVNSQKAYQYIPERNMVLSLPVKDALNTYSASIENTHRVDLGKEMVSGRMCTIRSVDMPDVNGHAKEWVDNSLGGYPIKIEVDGSSQVKKYLKNINTTVNLPDSLFELPVGVKVVDMGNMANDMSGVMNTMKENMGNPEDMKKVQEMMANPEDVKAMIEKMKEKMGNMPDQGQ